VIDAGVLFPEEDMLGVDLVIPDISYLVQNREKVRAIFITHGHEDHTGALPWVLQQINVPVYAPRLAYGLISVKLKEHKALRGVTLREIEPGKPIKEGAFRVEFFRVCHSIPDAMGLAITTPLGLVIHTGDFKIDHTPAQGQPTDLSHLARICADGVLLLFSDSTYAEVPGFTASEQVVGEALEHVIDQAPGRVMIATFASLIARVQQIMDAAARHGRKVGVVGRSMVDNVKMSLEMGYLSDPSNVLVPVGALRKLPPEQVVIVTTGSQGEPTSALVRIANKDHREVKIMPGDTVVISATPIPGNETVVSRTIDNLLRQGARVLYDKVATVHVHGHASQEELKIMLNLTRPKFFVPVHGEYRHLVSHGRIAQSLGMASEDVFILEDGDVLELTENGGKVREKVAAGHVFVDGLQLWDMKSGVLRDRRTLSRDGIVVVTMAIDKATGKVLRHAEAVCSGFVDLEAYPDLMERTAKAAMEAVDHGGTGGPMDWSSTTTKVKDVVGSFLYDQTHLRPIIIPVPLEI
ncbi:MAG: ribonuclease J, partial [Dehalococcoidia bacterium]|nr:ribonuclease J [Dehalococcoidia bacterium]